MAKARWEAALHQGISKAQIHLRAARRRATPKQRRTIDLQIKKLARLKVKAGKKGVGLVPLFLL